MSFVYKARIQLNDMFSQFSRFIAPMYYHDRCERFDLFQGLIIILKSVSLLQVIADVCLCDA